MNDYSRVEVLLATRCFVVYCFLFSLVMSVLTINITNIMCAVRVDSFNRLTHLVLRVALLPSVPSTRHSHYPSPLTLSFQAKTFLFCNSFFLLNLLVYRSLLLLSTPRIPRTVYRYFSAYPFLSLSFSFSSTVKFFCSVR